VGAAAQVSSVDYEPFGYPTSFAGRAQRFTFSGKEWFPSLLLSDFGFRIYNPSIGRWMNRDLIEEKGGINLFAFVNNQPVDQVDPFGLTKVCIRPLQLCPFTTIIVHCFLDMENGTTYSYDNHGIHADPKPDSAKRKCVDVSPGNINPEDVRRQVEADIQGGQWGGSDYGFRSHNCCHWVNHVLTSLGSPTVNSYFPGYSCPPNHPCQ